MSIMWKSQVKFLRKRLANTILTHYDYNNSNPTEEFQPKYYKRHEHLVYTKTDA